MSHSNSHAAVSKTTSNSHTTVKHIGIDDHKDTLAIAIADANGSEARYYGDIAHRPAAVRQLLTRMAEPDTQLICWYEAGPCGYNLYRQITAMGHACHVVAPSLTPRRSGQRVKTDRRDCVSLA